MTRDIEAENAALWAFADSVDDAVYLMSPLLDRMRKCRDALRQFESPTVHGIPEDIVGYRAATSYGPDVAVQRYG